MPQHTVFLAGGTGYMGLAVAIARCHGLRLVTADDRIRRWGRVPLV